MGETRHLVIIENDPGTRKLLCSVADTFGWRVEEGSGSENMWPALERADAVTLDIHLDTENGLDILRRMRREGMMAPVIVLTGDDGLEIEVEARAAGATHYLLKPFEVSELVAVLHAVVRHHDHVVIDLTDHSTVEGEPASEKAWFMS